MKKGLETLRAMGVPYRLELAAAHRTPARLRQFAEGAQESGLEVIICAAAGTSTTPAVIASHTMVPVIAVPVDSAPLTGQDCLLCVAQAAPGVPVATVGINAGENAALLATQMLATRHTQFRSVLQHQRTNNIRRLDASFSELVRDHPELCDPDRTSPTGPIISLMDDETSPGPEDVTPDPGPSKSDPVGHIRPGARLSQPSLFGGKRGHADWLVATPEPQEPGTATEDAELQASLIAELGAPLLQPESAPPPPLDEDLMPEALHSAPSPQMRETEKNIPPPPVPGEGAFDDLNGDEVETKVFDVDRELPDEDVLAHAMLVLREGGIVALSTDTVYGLAVDATNTDAIKRLYKVKGQDAQEKSVSILIHESGMLDDLVREVPPAIEGILESHWPGGLTVLFFRHPNILSGVSNQPSVAVRIPKDNVPLELMKQLNRPLAVINAAMGDSPAAINAHEVIDRFHGRIDCILNAGPCRTSQTSTVLSVLAEPFEILREGAIPREDLKKKLGNLLKD
ncbi:MAG: threonylcarbamoyl-AMP synthase [Candidatus Sumerlaeia bacterium]|nr:threonylcarbamoyl-AMP synthase [Candidatus Sumerlaeia bacterium]